MLIYRVIRSRWNSDSQSVYLIETDLDNHPLNSENEGWIDEYQLFEIWDYEKAKPLIMARLKEENLDQGYLNETRDRFGNGDRLLLISSKEPLSFIFISTSSAYFNQVGHTEPLPDSCFSVYDVYTFKKHRGKGLYRITLSLATKAMYAKGFTKFWLWVMKHNKVSVMVHDRLGVNQVIAVFTEYFKFGKRVFRKEEVRIKLSTLLDE